MRLDYLNVGDLGYIKRINIKDNELRSHLLEIGLVNNTKVKVLFKDKLITIISYRNINLLLSNTITRNIEVYTW